jgi:hypothetical protein
MSLKILGQMGGYEHATSQYSGTSERSGYIKAQRTDRLIDHQLLMAVTPYEFSA